MSDLFLDGISLQYPQLIIPLVILLAFWFVNVIFHRSLLAQTWKQIILSVGQSGWLQKKIDYQEKIDICQKWYTGSNADRKRFLFFIIEGLVILALAIAVLNPQWGEKEVERPVKGKDVLFLVDTSLSMYAKDISPSRMGRAKIAIRSLSQSYLGNRMGIIAFSGDAFLQCPLTSSRDSFLTFVEALQPGIVTARGTNLEIAVEKALDLFSDDVASHKVVILLSDGEQTDGDLSRQLPKLKQREITFFSLGIGTSRGTALNVPYQGQMVPLRNSNGSIYLSKIDEKKLNMVSNATNGSYFNISEDLSHLAVINEFIANANKNVYQSERVKVAEDQYSIFALFALLGLMVLPLLRIFSKNDKQAAVAMISQSYLQKSEKKSNDDNVIKKGRKLGKNQNLAKTYFILFTFFIISGRFLDADEMDNAQEHFANQNYTQSIAILQKKVAQLEDSRQQNSEYAYALYNLGTAYLLSGENEKALEILQRSAKFSEESRLRSHIDNNLGVAYARLGEDRLAFGAFAQALQAEAGLLTSQRNIVYLQSKQMQQPPKSPPQDKPSGDEKESSTQQGKKTKHPDETAENDPDNSESNQAKDDKKENQDGVQSGNENINSQASNQNRNNNQENEDDRRRQDNQKNQNMSSNDNDQHGNGNSQTGVQEDPASQSGQPQYRLSKEEARQMLEALRSSPLIRRYQSDKEPIPESGAQW